MTLGWRHSMIQIQVMKDTQAAGGTQKGKGKGKGKTDKKEQETSCSVQC